ncbi:MAG: NYN domain-containing protein [Acidobacteriota bacterium]
MSRSSYRLAFERLKPQRIAPAIERFYSRTEMIQVLRRAGFYLKGVRLESLSRPELVAWMAEAFGEHPDFGEAVTARLDEATRTVKAELAGTTPSRFVKRLGRLEPAMADGRLAEAVWALATDPRGEAGKALRRLTARATRSAGKTLAKMEELEEILLDAGNEEAEPGEAPGELQQQLSEAARRAEKAERKSARREKKVDSLRRKREEQARRIAALEEERAGLLKEKAGLERQNKRLVAKLGKPRHSPSQLRDAEQRIRQLEKEKGRLVHELEQAQRYGEEARSEKARREEIEQESLELSRALEKARDQASEERFTYEAVTQDLRAEVARLRARLTKERERRQPPAGRPRHYREQRVGIFLDISNLYLSALEYYRREIDYHRLTQTILNGRILAAAIAYNVETPWGNKKSFLEMLRGLGYETRTKDLVVRSDGSKKGDWDVGIAADIVERLGRLDVLALGSGDGDFLPVVQKARERGVSSEVYAFPNTASSLKEEADYYPIDESLLFEEVSRFARPRASMKKAEALEGIEKSLGVRMSFLGKLSIYELEKILRSLKSFAAKP